MYHYGYNFPIWNRNNIKIKKRLQTNFTLHCTLTQQDETTGNKEIINHFSNMAAQQVSGLSNEDSTWKIVTHKKKHKKVETIFNNKEFPALPKLSSAKEYQSDSDVSTGKTRRVI